MNREPKREARWRLRAQWVALALTSSLLGFDALGKLLSIAPVVEGTIRLGYGRHHVFWLGLVEALCTIVFIAPRTSLLGAVLLTGFLGGAVSTHVRLDQPFAFPLVAGMVVWTTALLRSHEARELVHGSLTRRAG